MLRLSKIIWFSSLFIIVIIPGTGQLPAQNLRDSLLQEINLTNVNAKKADIYFELVTMYIGQDRDSAEYFLEKAHRYMDADSDARLQALSNSLVVEIYRNDWSLDTLRELLLESNRFYKTVPDENEILSNLISLGAIYSDRSQYEEAIEFSLQALDLAKKLENGFQEAKLHYNLGVAYYNLSLDSLALRKFKDSAKKFDSIDRKPMAGIALGAACDVYQHIGFLDSAEMTARYLLALADSSQYTRLQYKALTVLGSVEAERKHYGQAITYYDRAIPFAHKFGTKNSLINCFCAMGEIKYELKEYKSGLEYFQQAYNLGSEFNQPILNHFCAKAYGKTLHQAGYHKQAGEILSSYIEYQDSVLLKENKEVIAGLEARYQSAQKDIDLAKQEVVIESRTRQRNSYIFALIIAGLFAWFLYDRFRKNQRISAEKIENMEKVQKIMVLNSMLQGQEDERRRIARDLHDGLGTLLAATRMQIQNVERELKKLGEIDLADKAQKLIDNACKEVRRISHDMMPGALEEMGLIAAVEDLIDDVRAQREIIYNLQLPDLELRLDKQKAINIYRIIQEVLQNIIKHAQANIVEISISEVEDHIVIDISDDGLGFEPEAIAEGGIGLSNINSRIRYLGGTMKLDSQPGEGSHYAFIIPV